MNLGAKRRRIRLSSEEYVALRRHVLERDGWRCQQCGSRVNLEIHHQKFKSQMGGDCEHNLITLCSNCHHGIHNYELVSSTKQQLMARKPAGG